VIDGLEADAETPAPAHDSDALRDVGKLIPADWQERLPNNASPCTSAIVFLVRRGNPKEIAQWPDLARSGVDLITPNPKTCGGARWIYLASRAFASMQPGGTDASAEDFVKRGDASTKVPDSGARGSPTTFTERGVGDVPIALEDEAYLSAKAFGPDKFEIVAPSVSILAEPAVSVVDKNVDKRGPRTVATAYAEYLCSPECQDLAARSFNRPRDSKVAARTRNSTRR
jgi:sulfate/thiosulfate transport system substrate-binding protein